MELFDQRKECFNMLLYQCQRDFLLVSAPQVKSIPFRCRLDLLSLGGYNNLCNSRRDNRCRDNDAKDVFDR
jgi:hypothetical protein